MDTSVYTNKRKLAMVITVLICIASIAAIIAFIPFGLAGIFAAIFVPITIVSIVVCCFYCKTITKQYKQIIVRNVFKTFDFDYYFANEGLRKSKNPYNIEEDEFYSLMFVNKTKGNTYYTNDLVVGEHQFVDFRSVDLYCYYIVSNGKSSSIITLFKGRVYALNLQADKDFRLVIREESDTFNHMADKSLKEIEFEAIDANKKFNFYTNDEHKAFYYIKPNIIENLMKLEETFDGKLFVSIQNGSLYVGKYDNRDRFELKTETTYETLRAEVDEEIYFIEQIIKAFKFDKAKPKVKEIKIK